MRCCELDTAALPGEPAGVAGNAGRGGDQILQREKYAEAEALALQVLDLAPNQRPALRVLFEIRKAQNMRAG